MRRRRETSMLSDDTLVPPENTSNGIESLENASNGAETPEVHTTEGSVRDRLSENASSCEADDYARSEAFSTQTSIDELTQETAV